MTRFYQIRDVKGSEQFQSEDLPLIIGSDQTAHIRINDESRAAYIGESEGHLFIQTANSDLVIFHNNEHLITSQWIKSGDVTRFKEQTVHYKISADRVAITVNENIEKVSSLSPQKSINTVTGEKPSALPRMEKAYHQHSSRNRHNRIIKYTFSSLMVFLIFLAFFVLMAKSIEVYTEPDAEILKLSGFPPAVKLGNRYLAMQGEYILRVEKKGYKIFQKKLLINDKHKTIDIKLEKLPGKLKLDLQANNGERLSFDNTEVLLDDGKYLVQTNPLIEIESGEHVIEISKERYKNSKHNITIEGMGTTQVLPVMLQQDWGILNAKRLPEGAELVIQSVDKNSNKFSEVITDAGKKYYELTAGDYNLEIKKKKFKTKVVKISIKAEQEIELPEIQLEPEDAFINIHSNTKNVIIFLNGKYLGSSLKRIKVASNKAQQIIFSAAGYRDKHINLTLKPEEEINLDINLVLEMGSIFINMNPAHANLYIDGIKQLKNNGRFKLNTKQHIIEAKANSYESKRIKITPDKEFSQQLNIKLHATKSNSKHGNKISGSEITNSMQVSNPHASRYKTFTGNKMILIKANEFVMGSAKNENGRRSNEYLRKVKISKNYYLSETEINNAQFRMYKSTHDSGKAFSLSLNKADQPVVNVSWNDAAKFCNWLSKKEGLTPYYAEVNGIMTADDMSSEKKKTGYRLPFESEWGYAARASMRKKISRYSWNGSYPPTTVSGNFADESALNYLPSIIKAYNDKYVVSSPVGVFYKNPAGFYDMGGNVSEWCHDFYSVSTKSGSFDNSEIDPRGPDKGNHHVVRDASWRDASITELRLTYRSYSLEARDDIGFRIARYAP